MSAGEPGDRLMLGEVVVELRSREVLRGGERSSLTPLEASLLAYLAAAGGQAVPREELQQEVWGYRPGIRTRAVDSAVVRLRKKIEQDPDEPELLLSSYGAGYRLVMPEPELAPLTLPVPPTAFVGRHAELEALSGRVSEAPALALRGLPGVGKTRLAAAFAAQWRGRVLWVDGAAAEDEAGLRRALAEAMGVPPGADLQALTPTLVTLDRPLLVIDGAESGGWALSEEGGRWLSSLDGVRALVTCREPAALAELEVAPLSEEDALALLEARASTFRPPGGQGEWRGALSALTPLLGGLPFLIERAAAQLAIYSPAALARKLSGRDGALLGLNQARVLESSLAVLSEEEQRTLAESAAFAGAFGLEEAAAVLSGAGTGERLEALARRSWLRPSFTEEGERRFSLMSPVRAWLQASGGTDLEAARERHRVYFLENTRRHLEGLEARWSDAEAARVRAAAPELLAAWERSLPDDPERAAELALALHHWPLSPVEPPEAARERLARTRRALGEGGSALLRGRLLVLEAIAESQSGRQREVAAPLEAALALSLEAGLPRLEVAALGELGNLAYAQGRLEDATRHYQRSATLAERHGWPSLQARSVSNLGNLARRMGDLESAEARYREALALEDGRSSPRSRAVNLANLAVVMDDRGLVEQAEGYRLQAEALLEEAGDTLRLSRLRVNRAIGLTVARRYPEALALLRAILEALEGTGQLHAEALAQAALGSAALLSGDEVGALEAHLAALDRFERIGLRMQVGLSRQRLGLCTLCGGRAHAAAEQLERSLEALEVMEMRPHASLSRCLLAIAWCEVGRLEEAAALAERVTGDHPGEPFSQLTEGWLAFRRGDTRALREALERTRETADQIIRFRILWRWCEGALGGA
jgi:DNA-binding winged helix-turn-helix (wHTH) protein/tetratricopeptide (TPR) repeat protein